MQAMTDKSQENIAIIGAGLSGLSCALELERQGKSCVIYDAAQEVGGRVQTKELDGFLLDRGFQVLLDSYPEVQRLNLGEQWSAGTFRSGAMVRHGSKWIRIENPIKHPGAWLRLPMLPKGFSGDLVRLGSWFMGGKEDPEDSTDKLLHHMGLSEDFIETFLRPFFGGVCLDLTLSAKATRFRTLMGYFFKGEATLPSGGMRALPQSLAKQLQRTELRLGQQVKSVQKGQVELSQGNLKHHDTVIVATDGHQAIELLNLEVAFKSRPVDCYYFEVPVNKLPGEDVLFLSGEQGPVCNLVFPGAVESSYVPDGRVLVSATVLGEQWLGRDDTLDHVQKQLAGWFPVPHDEWKLLEKVSIQHALPDQSMPPPLLGSYERGEGLYLCGELTDWPSINGALASGRRVAQAVTDKLPVR